MAASQRRQRFEDLLERLGLGQRRNHYPQQLRNALGTLFDEEGVAVLQLHAERGLIALGRTYNNGDNGTFGQLVRGFDLSADTTVRPGRVGHLAGLEESGAEGHRSNLGIFNLQPHNDANVRVDFYTAQGAMLGTITRDLSPKGYVQLDRVLTQLTTGQVRNVRAEVHHCKITCPAE